MNNDQDFSDPTINLNIRIPKSLKEGSASLLQSMGVNQSQYIRDALQYVVSHNALPWQVQSSSTILYKYSIIRHEVYQLITQASRSEGIDVYYMYNVCAKLDAVQLDAINAQEWHIARGMTSIPLCKFNGLLSQLTSLFRNSGHINGNCCHYEVAVSSRMGQLMQYIDEMARANNF